MNSTIAKVIYILWLTGFDTAPFLVQRCVESWRFHNPTWTVQLITWDNIYDFVNFPALPAAAKNQTMTPQALSDVIRLNILADRGGVWADSTMLCMTPLDGWVPEAMGPAGFWMYRGVEQPPPLVITRENTNSPASWFMLSEAGSYIATRWRDAAHAYWAVRATTDHYFWMDELFRDLLASDPRFRAAWACVPYLSCEAYGQAHMLNGRVHSKLAHFVARTIRLHPPFALKLSYKKWPEKPREDAAVFIALRSAEQRRVVGRNHSRHTLGGVSPECFAGPGGGGLGRGGGGPAAAGRMLQTPTAGPGRSEERAVT